MEGTRKFWMTVVVVVTLLVGLVITLAFKAMTDGMWTAWCGSVAGTGLVGVVANVVTKKLTGNTATNNIEAKASATRAGTAAKKTK